MSAINKNGIVSGTLYESGGVNILSGTNYTNQSPLVATGNNEDIIVVTDNVAKVTPGKFYYLLCQTDRPWSPSHGASTATVDKVTIWLYLYKTYNPESVWTYDSPVNFNTRSSSYIRDGLWYYKIPDGMNMARFRANTYSLNNVTVTAKFWDIKLIPEENFAEYCKIYDSDIIANDFMEI